MADDRYQIVEIHEIQKSFIPEIVYQAIYVHPGDPVPSREILNSPDLQKYYQFWGKKGDYGLIALDGTTDSPVGGAFVRYSRESDAGYGFVAEKYPELSIALLPDYRSHGIGTRLMEKLIENLRQKGCPGISLSVDKRNQAYRLYQKLGFKTVSQEGNPTMLLLLS